MYIYEATIYDTKADEITKDYIPSRVPPDLAKISGIHRDGKEIYLGKCYALDLEKPIADLSLEVIDYDK